MAELKKSIKKSKKTATKSTPSKKSSSTFIEFKGFLSFLILHELNSAKLCGDDLAEKIGKRKGAFLTPGTIYPALKILREHKLIKFSQDGRKKIYTLTPNGKKELKALYKLFSKYFQGFKSKITEKKPRNKVLKKKAAKKKIKKKIIKK